MKIKISFHDAAMAFELDDKIESGLRWKKGYGGIYSGDMAGYKADRGYKSYWQVRWNYRLYYCSRIIQALKSGKDVE